MFVLGLLFHYSTIFWGNLWKQVKNQSMTSLMVIEF